ncbi:hypothetical protein Tco_0490611 [Tanacetum coccineum]
MGEDSAAPSDSHSIPIISQPSSSKPQKKKSRRKHRKDGGSIDPVTAEAHEIASLKKRVKQLEKRRKLRTPGLKRLKKGRKIVDLDADAEVTLVDETQEMNDDNLMFDTDVLEEQEKQVTEKEVSTADPVTTTGEVVTAANKSKQLNPKAVTSAATTTTTTRPKARGVVVQEPSEFKKTLSPLQASQLPQNLESSDEDELIEEERLARQKEEEANIDLIESWDNMQAMMEADFELAQRLQARKGMNRGEDTIEKRSKIVWDELESDKSKKQKIDEHVEAEKDDDPEEEEMKKHMEIVQDEEEIAIVLLLPLAIKPPMIA